eukprot:6179367-Pleurochrysis_carterae.AAC.3
MSAPSGSLRRAMKKTLDASSFWHTASTFSACARCQGHVKGVRGRRDATAVDKCSPAQTGVSRRVAVAMGALWCRPCLLHPGSHTPVAAESRKLLNTKSRNIT